MELITLTSTSIPAVTEKASEVLKKGGIILYPTDTIYGLGVDATNDGAIERLKSLKGRDKKKPISIIVKSVEDIEHYARMNDTAKELAREHLPGPLTLVLPAGEGVSKELMLHGTIGVRIPDDALCLGIAEAFGGPFTTTSANKAGRETARTVEEILAQFGELAQEISFVIDAGERKHGLPSTVVLATSDIPYILREGALSRDVLGLH